MQAQLTPVLFVADPQPSLEKQPQLDFSVHAQSVQWQPILVGSAEQTVPASSVIIRNNTFIFFSFFLAIMPFMPKEVKLVLEVI